MQSRETRTPLILAAAGGNATEVLRLVGAGADVTRIDAKGRSALTVAVQQRLVTTYEALIAAGADPDHVDSLGRSALSIAARTADIGSLERLLKLGADPNYKAGSLLSPYVRAIHDGNPEVIETLGANGGRGAESLLLIAAARSGSAERARAALASGADVRATFPDGTTALMYAAEGHHLDVVTLLIEAGSFVNRRDNLGRTPMIRACQAVVSAFDFQCVALFDVVRTLVASGAKVDICDVNGVTALSHFLEHHRQADVVRFLLEEGASATLADKKGRSPLAIHVRSLWWNRDIVEMLLDGGGDLHTGCSVIGDEAFPFAFHAAILGSVDVVELLVERGVDPLERHDGMNLLDCAALAEDPALLELLAQRLADEVREPVLNRALLFAAMHGRLKTTRALLGLGADINVRESNSMTPLRHAFRSRKPALVAYLLENGADTSVDGRVLLRHAILYQLDDLARLLVAAGIEVDNLDTEELDALRIVTNPGPGRWILRPRAEVEAEPKANSIRALPGGLPGLGKRR